MSLPTSSEARRDLVVRAYVTSVTLVGAALLLGFGVVDLPDILADADLGLAFLAVAVLVGELVPIRLGPDEGEVAPSTTFTFALLLAYGVPAAAIAQAIACIVADVVHRKPVVRSAFNVAQYVLAIAAAGAGYALITGEPPRRTFELIDLLATGCAGVIFFLVNTGAVAIAVALSAGTRLRHEVSSDLIRHGTTEAILIGLAPLAVIALEWNPALLPLLVLPLFAVQRAARHARLSERLALHDALTGLPNRVLLADRLTHAIAARARRHDQIALLLLDLDRFKVVNDSLGHDAGDELLRQVAGRLTGVVRAPDTVARLGGDEFVVLLESIATPEEASEVAARIQTAISRPMSILGSDIVVSASVGIAIPEEEEHPEALLRHADLAMYRAKAEGRGRHEQFVEAMAVTATERMGTETALRRALHENELRLLYQPIVDLETRCLVGLEALIRWQHPERGLLGPGAFLPVARDSGLIVPLTGWVVRESLEQLQRWRAAGLTLGTQQLHVNIPAGQLADTQFAARLMEHVQQTGNDPQQLCLEVTEDAVVEVGGLGVKLLRQLREHGIGIALDDFGTGYSSLSQLRHLPVDILKIDLSFVASVTRQPADASIVRTIVNLAHGLGLIATAEGVETDEQVRVLRDLGCERGQGYRFDRPLTPSSVGARLEAATATAPTSTELR